MSKKITVHVRLKDNCFKKDLWEVKDNILYQKINETTQLSYSCYQNVFFMIGTEDVYNKCVKNIVQDVLNGTNCTIFAYGQTGSGKTYTMLGTEESPGIIKLSLRDILDDINVKSDEYTKMEVSYIEIYNESVNDLINLDMKVKIYILNNSPFISNISKIQVRNMDEALVIIEKCENRRKTGQTEYNERSSRSHTIFQVYITKGKVTSTLSLIDLAGSERASGNSDRRTEGAFINKSLLALGSVVNKLIKNEYVNYRDSKLTRILQQSLDGNGNVVSLCMMSPDEDCILESISTLKFAARLSKVELKEKQLRIVTKIKEPTICGNCRCCQKMFDDNNRLPCETIVFDNKNEKIDSKDNMITEQKTETINFEILAKEEAGVMELNETEEYRKHNMLLKAENDLYVERIKSLEDTLLNIMTQYPSKRVNDLFVLEKNMFQLQLEMIKRRKNN